MASSGSLGSLVVTLAADTARFQGDLGRAAAVAESRMRNIKDTASKALGALTVAATAAGAALTAAFTSATKRADEMGKLAQSTGTTVEALSRLDYAANLAGVETDLLGKALAKLAKDGATDTESALLSLATQFQGMKDGAAKTALAVDTFGERIGPKLIPFLNQGAAGIKALGKEADKLGVTISTGTAQASEQFNDNLTRLGMVTRGFGNSLAEALLPTMNALADEMVRAAKNTDFMDRTARVAATGMKLLLTTGELIRSIFSQIGQTVGALAAALVQLAKGNFSESADIISQRYRDLVDETQESATRILNIWEGAARSASVIEPPKIAPSSFTSSKELDKIAEGAQKAADAMNEATSESLAASTQALTEYLQEEIRLQNASSEGWREYYRDRAQAEQELYAELFERQAEASAKQAALAERTAQQARDAWGEQFFVAMDEGLDSLVDRWRATLKSMVADALGSGVLNLLKGGSFFGGISEGLGSSIAGLGKLFGFARGGSFKVGGSGGIDSQIIGPFRATPGEEVTITPPGGRGQSAPSTSISIAIDARNSTPDSVDKLKALAPQLAKQIEDRIVEKLRRGNYTARMA